ncbi:hypothetical protein GW934_03825 [Candidatus Falkowbacteria bacterium]|nr:hypothetical protein [Candidatus Falkowbacteria bacterium]
MKGNKHCLGKKNALGKHWKIKDISKMKGNTYWKGKYRSQETKRKMSLAHKGKIPHEITDEIRRKMSEAKRGTIRPLWVREKLSKARKGNKNPSWKGGINFRKKRDKRNDSAYQAWIKAIKERDNWKCKINNKDCYGYCEVHHILSWRKYPELRYNINNGITLCQFHHPRKRVEERRLIPFFQKMVRSKVLI